MYSRPRRRSGDGRPRRRRTRVAAVTPGTVTWLAAGRCDGARRQPVYERRQRARRPSAGALPGVTRARAVRRPTGADVRQLERRSRALGYAAGLPDRRRRLDLGHDRGRQAVAESPRPTTRPAVEHGDVLFTPAGVRVAERLADVGDPRPGDRCSTYGRDAPGSSRSPWDQSGRLAPVGAKATARRCPTAATSRRHDHGGEVVTRRASSNNCRSRSRPPTSTSTGSAGGHARSRSVLNLTARPDVLTVPVAALVALAEGGYGVQKVVADGTPELRRGRDRPVRRRGGSRSPATASPRARWSWVPP